MLSILYYSSTGLTCTRGLLISMPINCFYMYPHVLSIAKTTDMLTKELPKVQFDRMIDKLVRKIYLNQVEGMVCCKYVFLKENQPFIVTKRV